MGGPMSQQTIYFWMRIAFMLLVADLAARFFGTSLSALLYVAVEGMATIDG